MLKAICSRKELISSSYYCCISDIIDLPQLEQLKDIKHHISTTRFQHCVNVSYYSYIVCRKLHLNARSAARAGLLHDLFYYDRKDYNSARMKGDPSHSRHHSAIALKNAKRITEVNAIEEDMIAKHMWPMTLKLPKYRETYVITFIDKYCAVLEFCVPQITRIAVKKRIKPSVTERKNIQGGYSDEY